MHTYLLITPQMIRVAINKNTSTPTVIPTTAPTEISSSDLLGETDGVAKIVGDTTELIDGVVVNVSKGTTIFSTVKRKKTSVI